MSYFWRSKINIELEVPTCIRNVDENNWYFRELSNTQTIHRHALYNFIYPTDLWVHSILNMPKLGISKLRPEK